MRKGLLALALISACGQAPVAVAPLQLSHTSGPSQTFLNNGKCIAVDDSARVHAMWMEATQPGADGLAPQGAIYYTRSTDGGASFAEPVAITAVVAQVGAPKIVAAGGDTLYAVWHQGAGGLVRIFFARSDDAGLTWATLPTPLADGAFPSLAVGAAGAVHVVFDNPQRANSTDEIFTVRSTDAGHTFSPPLMVSSDDHHTSWTGTVAASGNVVHVAWTDERHDTADCAFTNGGGNDCHEEEYYRRSLDGGVTWEPETRLTDDPGSSWCPTLVAEGSAVQIAWFDQRGGQWQVFQRRSRDDGATWDGERSITHMLGGPVDGAQWLRPSLAKHGATLAMAVWVQAPGAEGAWWTRSTDDGDSWSATQLLSTASPARHPSLILDGNTAHVVWYQPEAGTNQMFYRKLLP